MNGDPTDLTKERRRQARDWSPQEALEFALEDIKAGRVDPMNVVVLMEHKLDPNDEDSNVVPLHYSSAMSNSQFVAMLEIQKVMAMQRWLGPMWTSIAEHSPPEAG